MFLTDIKVFNRAANCYEITTTDMCVYLCRSTVLVTEKLLYIPDIQSALVKMRLVTVPQTMDNNEYLPPDCPSNMNTVHGTVYPFPFPAYQCRIRHYSLLRQVSHISKYIQFIELMTDISPMAGPRLSFHNTSYAISGE
jgi:hypothetical protein